MRLFAGVEQYAIRAFGDALEALPVALAGNSGLSPISTIADIKARQLAEKNPRLGVDCLQRGTLGMRRGSIRPCHGTSIISAILLS